MPETQEPLISERVVEERWGFSKNHLRKRREAGDHPTYYKDGRHYFYRASDIEAWLDAKRVEAPAASVD